MANKRTLSWNAAMRDLRNERLRRTGLREERLTAAQGSRQTPLSSWRGHSGRRYIVGIHPLTEESLLAVTGAVILAVRRDEEGTAHLIEAAMAGARPDPESRRHWLARMRDKGAGECHIHRLAGSDAQRRAILDDLRDRQGDAPEAGPTVSRPPRPGPA